MMPIVNFALEQEKKTVSIPIFASTQCGIFRIFLSYRFYVKSILGIVQVLIIASLGILGGLNFDLVNFNLEKVQ